MLTQLPVAADPLQKQLSLAARARSYINAPQYIVHGRAYPPDCSGFVMAVYAAEGYPLDKIVNGDGSAVAVLFNALSVRGLVHANKVPAIGDLVFFDNTFDRNRDGQPNDPITHVGIVESADPDGTISIIHHVRQGILRYKMNLFQPHLRKDPRTHKVLNHFLRLGSTDTGFQGRRLTGELFHAFATVIR